MTVLIALCVPHDQREQAKAAGAVFDGAEKCWKAHVDHSAEMSVILSIFGTNDRSRRPINGPSAYALMSDIRATG